MDLTDSGEVHVVEFIKFLTRLTENDPAWRADILEKQFKDSLVISKEGVEKIVSLITKSSASKDIKDLHKACKAMMKGLGIKSHEDQAENELFIQLMLSTSKVSRRFTVPRNTNRRFSRYRVRSLVMKDEGESLISRFIPKKVRRVFEQKRRHITTLFIFFGIIVALMVDRIYFFLFLNESAGIRQITEVGLLMSRSTAAALSFIYPMMLLSMCRNLLTKLRQKSINQFIPFDQSVEFHKLAAYVGAFFSIIHVIGHFLNFYLLAEAPYQAASCVLPQVFTDEESEKSFFQLLFASHQGITGLLLILVMSIIYSFAAAQSRRKRHKVFWKTHMLYPIFFVLLSLHGLQALLQEPKFIFYLVGPGIIFLIDKTIELRRSYVEVPLKEFDLLQSSVTCLKMKRPKSFDYHSGQWIRIALPEVSKWEFHPFTLTSCPADDFISCHVRAVGPWTISLREYLKKVRAGQFSVPRMYVDGPIGEGHQNWHKFECSVLVGAGIGITPFASILKDIVGRNMSMTKCKKVVFIWVKRSDKQFEWMVDILKEAEKASNMIETHVFITQKKGDFDLRTLMRYFLENKLDSPCGKSLFTGLRTVTHFGRPDFNELLEDVQQKNSAIGKIGVFSCGPPALSKAVDKAAKHLNKYDNALFEHFFENF